MYRLLSAAPFWLYLAFALLVAAGTELAVKDATRDEAEKVIALQQDPPPIVDLSYFDKETDVHLLDEIHITGWFNPDYNYHLVQRKNGRVRSERNMFVLFGEYDTSETKVAKAALLLTNAQKEQLAKTGTSLFNMGFAPDGVTMTINGSAETSVTQSAMAKDALQDEGLTLSEHFVFVVPYWKGRDAALAPQPDAASDLRQVGYAIALISAVIGLVKFKNRNARKADQRRMSPAAAQRTYGMTAPAQPQAVPTPQRLYAPASGAPKIGPQTTKPRTPTAKRKRLPNWFVGLIVVILVLATLPAKYIGFVMPLLIVGIFLFLAKKSLEGIGIAVNAARSGASALMSSQTGLAPPKPKDSPFDRLR